MFSINRREYIVTYLDNVACMHYMLLYCNLTTGDTLYMHSVFRNIKSNSRNFYTRRNNNEVLIALGCVNDQVC